jgi:SAM-dependent methyltransferase
LLNENQLKEVEQCYPLHFLVCKECQLAQIDYVVDPNVLFFPDYPYRSGITQSLVCYLQDIAKTIVNTYDIEKGALVIDIGSNDGTLLQGFKNYGMKVLGIEPTNIAFIANNNGIQTLNDFYSEDINKTIIQEHGKASVVTATNMFAHVNNLGELMRGVSGLLVDGGIFLTESHYLLNILETVQYDSIYHEHLKYYSLKSITKLFNYYDFTVTDAEKIPNYGGSIRVVARRGKGFIITDRLKRLLEKEDKASLDKLETYYKFKDDAVQSKLNLQKLLIKLRSEGKRVPGVGCPGRASTLLNYCNVDPELMPYIAEQSECLKLGMSLPGKHIPIIDEKTLLEENPEYCIMLSWHYAEAIIKNLRKKGLKSKIILPLPKLKIFE